MLMRTDPFRELDRLSQQLFGTNGTTAQFDLPGLDPAAIDLDVERNVLTIKAERTPTYREDVELQVAERPRGVSWQLFLGRHPGCGDTLDAERIEARYDAGVLTLRLPIARKAKPRKIPIAGGNGPKVINA